MPSVMDINHILCQPAEPKRRRPFKQYNLGTHRLTPHNPLRVAWTPNEDTLLQQGYAQGLSWGMISSTYLPHRSRGCCWGRFKMLQSKHMISTPAQRFLGRPWKMMNN
ncbi:hypothetical protein K501DRAFT_287246 [Backusella circina FSU 941]|nr:hypothetical protein K501DRAFT_287246 [Backusella circina FSU 941]